MAKGKKSRAIGGYKNYGFKTYDPILDQFATLRALASEGRPEGRITNSYLSSLTGVSASTYSNWDKLGRGEHATKRPQFAPMKASVRALGGQLSITYKGKEIGRKS